MDAERSEPKDWKEFHYKAIRASVLLLLGAIFWGGMCCYMLTTEYGMDIVVLKAQFYVYISAVLGFYAAVKICAHYIMVKRNLVPGEARVSELERKVKELERRIEHDD